MEEVGHHVHDIFSLCSCYQWAAEEELLLHLIFRDEPSINQKLCDVCGLIKLDGEEGRELDFLRHLKLDVLGHVIDALLNCVVRETYLIKLVDTVLIENKTSSLYHARFNERLSNRVWLLLLHDKKGDLVRGLDDLAVLKENSCSMIQS